MLVEKYGQNVGSSTVLLTTYLGIPRSWLTNASFFVSISENSWKPPKSFAATAVQLPDLFLLVHIGRLCVSIHVGGEDLVKICR
jgi:hypothetical protein